MNMVPVKKLVSIVVLTVPPLWVQPVLAQVKLVPKSAATRADPCMPIGQTADRKLVYSLKCENLPGPPPPPQAEIEPPPPPQPEIKKTGIFGFSYEVKRPDQ
jgi:hypothetical protein